tara:strand:- start:27988 stop:29571 length:1584 start_codon:yes stop_codon:yes gene_type:complete
MKSIIEYLTHNYNEHKSLTAIRVNDQNYSYEELFNKSLKVATALLANGASNETVAVIGHRNFSTYVGILGILFAGCNYTPIDPKKNKSKTIDILRGSKVKHFIGQKSEIETLHEMLGEEVSIFDNAESIITPCDNLNYQTKYNWIDLQNVEEYLPLEDFSRSDESNLAYVLYTSGSTGEPKGVQVTVANLCFYIDAISELWKLPIGFKMSQYHDLSFDPSVSDIFYTLCNKGTLCVVPESEMLLPSDFIKRESLDIWSSVPSIGIFMSKMGTLLPNNFTSLKIVRFAGEPFNRYLADSWQEAAPNASIENHYGPTEATIDVTRHIYSIDQRKDTFNNNIIPIGQSFPGMKIRIIDTNDKLINDGRKGEIIFTGPQISNGYLNDQKKTDKSFVKYGWDDEATIWYRSGDLGFVNKNNNIECVGRIDSQIKIGGRRIEIGEIEFVLSKFNATSNSIVVPLKNDFDTILGCVAFTVNKITKEEIAEIRKNSTNYLDSVFFPKKIIFIEILPKTPSGKVNRKELEVMAREV